MILIIGAGISGLSIANFLKSDNYLILDKEDEPGGYCRTVKQDGFVWDYSGHFFHFRHPEIKDYLLSEMDQLNLLTIKKRSQVYYNGLYIDFPFQRNIHQLPQDEFIDCLYDLYFRPSTIPKNFREMLVTKFGTATCEKFLFPYNEKLYACDLNTLDVDAMGRFFPYAELEDVISNFKHRNNDSYNATFTYHKGGAYEYVKSLLKRVPPEKIALNETVVRIDTKLRRVYTNKREMSYELLISSIPFDRLLKIASVPYEDDIYTYNKVLVFNLGFDRKGDPHNHWVYFPEKKYIFYRIGYYDNIFDDPRMSLYVEVGLHKNQSYHEGETLKQVLEDLKNTGIITDQKLVSYHSVLLDPAYVHITQKSKDDVDYQKSCIEKAGIYSIGRYGSWTYCSIEDNIVEAKTLVQQLKL